MFRRINKYKKLAKIGEGTYGVVYKAQDTQTNKYVALKKIRLKPEEEGTPSTAIREIAWLKELNQINIVKLLDVIQTSKKLILVFEFCDSDLKKIMDSNKGKPLSEEFSKLYLYQIIKGINYIHKYKILHRDLKPQNWLINKNGILKICDFGLARGVGVPVTAYTNEVVTLWYRPPDIWWGNKVYDTSIDIWGIACIFGEMWIGSPFFLGKNENEQLNIIFSVIGTPDETEFPWLIESPEWNGANGEGFKWYSKRKWKDVYPQINNDDAYDWWEKMWVFDPEKRIGTEELWKHKYFDSIQEVIKKIYI